jgi:hypothetical protein
MSAIKHRVQRLEQRISRRPSREAEALTRELLA